MRHGDNCNEKETDAMLCKYYSPTMDVDQNRPDVGQNLIKSKLIKSIVIQILAKTNGYCCEIAGNIVFDDSLLSLLNRLASTPIKLSDRMWSSHPSSFFLLNMIFKTAAIKSLNLSYIGQWLRKGLDYYTKPRYLFIRDYNPSTSLSFDW